MGKYLVESKTNGIPWQVINETGNYKFIADEDRHETKDAGPNPVQYLIGSLNSCLTISASMIIKVKNLDVQNFHLITEAETEKYQVSKINVKVFFKSKMTQEEKQNFLNHILHVSVVYQTLSQGMKISVELA
ncbi:OsmC family protein [Lactobacillus sp. PV037]|uniref:OsmC family protein n=1 Tax=unclassified Lactobacillus TaxID=2620435 RepID=UPI002240D2E3|nr:MULTISPECIES: OsmC family protein [unclassified Lactobacillus]QNQ82044.1 OsmC family protein [Lactobacillus sp. PV012]QNQ83921.1 OsmC family protein [Lactobacillus sp. PV037]